jgi:hypothetical protein
MANKKRPEKWWNSKPKMKEGKVMCVAISPSGEETTDWFSLEELTAHLTKRALDVCPMCDGKKYLGNQWMPRPCKACDATGKRK